MLVSVENTRVDFGRAQARAKAAAAQAQEVESTEQLLL